jgi:hypothetical protein
MTDEQLAASGVGADMIRFSVGLEEIDDICWDLNRALTRAVGAGSQVMGDGDERNARSISRDPNETKQANGGRHP